MLNLIGAMLILVSGTMLGFHVSDRFAKRTGQIRLMLHALQRLETEIAYGRTPLPAALDKIGRQAAEPVSGLFRHASELMSSDLLTTEDAWRKAVDANWPQTAMKESEKEVLKQLGGSLGASDSADQIKHLRLAMSQLRMEEENAAEDQRKYAKMWRSLGALCGALVVILVY